MRIDELGLDPRIVRKLKDEGIETLYPPQEQAIGPTLARKNVVLAIPTASGKSLVAYLAILQAVLRGGKALYIVPLKALASEKFDDLAKFQDLGIRVGESTGDYDEVDPKLHHYDIVVATSEKADSLLRHRSKWLDQLSVVVADEVHLINDPDRGPTLEVTLVKFRTFNPTAQIIALSATIRNASELAEWLGAELIESDWRPVPLKEGVYADGKIFFTDNSKRILLDDEEPVQSLVKSALGSGGQCLVFVNTRKASESLAGELGKVVKTVEGYNSAELGKVAKRLIGEQDEPTTMGSKLGKSLKNGCAFHHAGLTGSQRKLVESNFKKGLIRCIVATPTLAAGINLPARTVLVRDVKRFDSNIGYTTIPVLEVKQMCGRAGRPRFDTYGEAILIARNEEEKDMLLESYLLGENENIYSKLGTEPAIRSHVLALIATKAASSIDDLKSFFGKTFGILHAICSVPDMGLLYLRQSDYSWIEDFEVEMSEQLLIEPPSDLGKYEIFLSEIKTAKLLSDWMSEVHENDIAHGFNIGPGDIRNKMELAEWLIHAMARLAGLFNKDALDEIREMRTRIRYGIKGELLDLVKMRGVGRVRARALFDRGIRSIEDLRTTSYDRLKQIPTIGEAVARSIKDQLGQSDPGMPVEIEDEQRSLKDYR
ncbi:MAG TPA: DEAD/DEAH box helicase [Thermoplasmata archaeon]|nr:DEAD/DEAH box helicase [Thermoplasmata archaeon]